MENVKGLKADIRVTHFIIKEGEIKELTTFGSSLQSYNQEDRVVKIDGITIKNYYELFVNGDLESRVDGAPDLLTIDNRSSIAKCIGDIAALKESEKLGLISKQQCASSVTILEEALSKLKRKVEYKLIWEQQCASSATILEEALSKLKEKRRS